jgi:hypothetical protein
MSHAIIAAATRRLQPGNVPFMTQLLVVQAANQLPDGGEKKERNSRQFLWGWAGPVIVGEHGSVPFS